MFSRSDFPDNILCENLCYPFIYQQRNIIFGYFMALVLMGLLSWGFYVATISSISDFYSAFAAKYLQC